MIRTRENPIVPRDQPDNRGLGEAMIRAADEGPAEAELQRRATERAEYGEARLAHATRVLFIDALYRAKITNGDAAFDLTDLDDLDTVDDIAGRITARRLERTS
jgi:hypothetical protein